MRAVPSAHGQAPPAAPSDDAAALEAALQADAAAATPPPPEAAAPPTSSGGLQSYIPDIAVIADLALAAFSDDTPLQNGAHDPVRTGFNLQQLELSIGASVDPYFRFDSNLVFSEFGVEIEEAYATTLDLPARLQLRAGQFLTRFGRINASHPHSWDFIDQPFAISRVFGGEGNRGLGVELSWLTPLPWYVELVGSSTMADGEATARSFFGARDLGVEGPADLLYVTALKQFFPLSDDWSLAWGLSAAFGPNSTGRSNRTAIYGTDVFLKWRPIGSAAEHAVELQSEWFYRRRQRPARVLQDLSGFAALVVHFDKRWSSGARYEYGSPSHDSELDVVPDDLDPEWIEPRQRVTALVEFAPTEFSRLRLQGSVDLPEYREDPIWAAMIGLEVAIGAHGAHSF
jgi:hypothetical protein